MRSLLHSRWSPLVLLVLGAAAGPLALLLAVGGVTVSIAGAVHFWALAGSGTAAAAAAFALTAAGARRGDGRTVLMGTAFATMATLLLIHGVATPGVLADPNGVVAISGAAVLPVGAAILAASTLPSLRRPRAIRPLLVTQAAMVLVIVVLGALGLAAPSLLPRVPESGSLEALGVLVFGLALLARVIVRSVDTWVLTRRRADLLVVAGAVWLAVALGCQMLLNFGQLGWWMGHALEFAGIALFAAPVALDLYRDRQSRPLLGDLRAAELVAAEEAFLGVRVRALMIRLAGKDPSTEEHTRRVARLAVEVGEELGLAPRRLRELAIGGLLHDIGKLRVPDTVLRKPGALDADEFALIQRHPRWGHDLLVELGGFSRPVRELVLSHHERLDGAGYPDGAACRDLALETRILTVCDVYDALVSDRVYRKAWSHERAIGLLREESGSAYDPRCVEALERVLAGSAAAPAVRREAARRRRVARPLATAAAALALVFATLGAAAAAYDGPASPPSGRQAHHGHHDHAEPASGGQANHGQHDHAEPAASGPAGHGDQDRAASAPAAPTPASQGGGAYYAP